ncbi:MAG: DUF721 domain-containing protein [Xanthomonadales bacterium]|jgi:hypothetical protein|nr:DUF721 domain-containing protein [Xanthomonadales bacterium]
MSDDSFPRSFDQMNRASSLGPMVERAIALRALDQNLRRCLPLELSQHCVLANVREGQLVFLVPSPIWHTRLRMESDTLLRHARSLGVTANRVTAKVVQDATPPLAQTLHKPLSPAAAGSLREAAERLSDTELRQQLLALASMAGD